MTASVNRASVVAAARQAHMWETIEATATPRTPTVPGSSPHGRLRAFAAMTLPRQLRQLAKYAARSLAPFAAQLGEVSVTLVETATATHRQTVALIAHQVDGHADRQVAAHGRIERDEYALGRLSEARRGRNDAVDDRLAVLRLAGLEKRRVCAGFDEVAFRIDAEKPHRLAANLSAQYKGCVEAQVAVLEISAVAAFDIPHRVRDQHGDVEHGPHAPQIRRVIAFLAALAKNTDHRLRAGKITRAQHYDHAIAGPIEHGHLAKLGEVVDSSVRL